MKKKVDPETYFFAVYYFFLLLDEEHSSLSKFKYIGQLKAFNICPEVCEEKDKFYLKDSLSKKRIVRINGRPAMDYIDRVMQDFPLNSVIGGEKIFMHAHYIHIYNPFYPIASIETETKTFTIKSMSRKLGK